MRRPWPLLLAVTLATGCAMGESAPITLTVTALPTAPPSVAASSAAVAEENSEGVSVAEPGIFASQFHPCEEFSPDQLEEAGLGKSTNVPSNLSHGIQACGFGPADTDSYVGTFLVATDEINRQHVQALDREPMDWSNSSIDGVYVHKMSAQVRQCTAAIDLDWGRFLVDYMETGVGWEPDVLCAGPAAILESLITQTGGINETENR